jgi:hypothetical protein
LILKDPAFLAEAKISSISLLMGLRVETPAKEIKVRGELLTLPLSGLIPFVFLRL